MDLDDVITLADGANELGIAAVTLRAAVSRGRVDARKVGNSSITTRQELARYHAENFERTGRPGARGQTPIFPPSQRHARLVGHVPAGRRYEDAPCYRCQGRDRQRRRPRQGAGGHPRPHPAGASEIPVRGPGS